MKWEIVSLAGNLGEYRHDWDRLNREIYQGQPFFDSRFIEPMLSYFATGKERLCIHSQDGVIDGLLILTPRRPGVWSIFAPAQAQIAPILLKKDELLASLITSLPGFPLSIELLRQDPCLTPIVSTANDSAIIREPNALTIAVALTHQFSDYWSLRSKKLQQNQGRYLRRLQKNSISVQLECHETTDGIREAVDRYGIMESQGWKGRQGTSLHADNVQGAFYTELMGKFAESGSASVYELYFDDRMAASRLCVSNSEMLIMLKTTYDENLSQYAPGRLLLHAVLEREFSLKRVKSIEFYTNANQDQISWSTDQRMIQHLTFFRHPLLKWTYLARKRLRRSKVLDESADQE